MFEFWRHRSEIIIFWPFVFIFSFTFIISGIVLMIIKDLGFAGMILAGIIPLIISFILIISDTKLLSKIIISDKGIEWKKFKKQILFIDWHEIIEIKTTPISPTARYLSFVSNKGKIDLELTKKIYNTIMIVCPDSNVKMQINDLKDFKYLHKNNKI